MEGHFAVFSGETVVAGPFADDVSADEYRRSLDSLPAPVYDDLEVRALCSECAQHPEAEDGRCTWKPGEYRRDMLTMYRILEGLRHL